jgi:hypothetical protein
MAEVGTKAVIAGRRGISYLPGLAVAEGSEPNHRKFRVKEEVFR